MTDVSQAPSMTLLWNESLPSRFSRPQIDIDEIITSAFWMYVLMVLARYSCKDPAIFKKFVRNLPISFIRNFAYFLYYSR